MSIAANILIIVLECIAFYRRLRGCRLSQVVVFYTQISNFIALVSSVLYLFLFGKAVMLRYLGTCMLTMTFLITLFVLVPMGGGFKKLMLGKTGLYQHTLCPVISLVSYVLWEPHSHAWYVPVIVTLVYGLTMIYLNAVNKVEGPYPFFWVHKQSKTATVMWILVLMLVISAISIAIFLISKYDLQIPLVHIPVYAYQKFVSHFYFLSHRAARCI